MKRYRKDELRCFDCTKDRSRVVDVLEHLESHEYVCGRNTLDVLRLLDI